ncbi:hypothetical protein B0H16DRAFT_1453641 [Mycena metata]|uniref:Uncharacterized protein n=1 Tax=Mycena metata TaxID=1033252 RepID=A0AAD7JLC1_9AGAR|nr:hypothetical protein B0H16DRAFT_1453641 [Mycena metata]
MPSRRRERPSFQRGSNGFLRNGTGNGTAGAGRRVQDNVESRQQGLDHLLTRLNFVVSVENDSLTANKIVAHPVDPAPAVFRRQRTADARPVAVPLPTVQDVRRNGTATRRTGPVEPARRARCTALIVVLTVMDGDQPTATLSGSGSQLIVAKLRHCAKMRHSDGRSTLCKISELAVNTATEQLGQVQCTLTAEISKLDHQSDVNCPECRSSSNLAARLGHRRAGGVESDRLCTDPMKESSTQESSDVDRARYQEQYRARSASGRPAPPRAVGPRPDTTYNTAPDTEDIGPVENNVDTEDFGGIIRRGETLAFSE